MRKLSAALNLGTFGLKCAAQAYNFWQGGNQWSAWAGFLSFFRHVAKLKIDYCKWDAYETLAIHSGPRIVHADFCIISDRPIKLTVDDQNRPHAMEGAFCEWSDGNKLYSIHGVRMPMWVCETPAEKLDPEKIMSLTNVEQRLMAIQKIGAGRMLKHLKGRVISEGTLDESGLIYRLHEVTIEGEKNKLFEMKNPSEPKVHYEFVLPECETIQEADLWRRGFDNFKQTYKPTGARA